MKTNPKKCPHCGAKYHPWWECPKVQKKEVPSSYGWKFGRGQNQARNEAFYNNAAANPFGGLSEYA
jgi:hypothetical protein